MHKILISGYYGFDNIGDESILRTLISSLREKMPGCCLTVLSHNPESTIEKYNVRAVNRMSPIDIIREVKNCDMLISGGGSLLQDVTSSKSLHYYLAVIRLAKLFGKKVFIYSQGIGPIDKAFNRRAVAKTLKKADGIVVRDEKSAALLRETGIPGDRIVITADPVIRMQNPGPEAGAEILRAAGIVKGEAPLIGWAVRGKNTDRGFEEEIVKSILWLKEKQRAISVLIPFHYDEDIDVCSRIAEESGSVCLKEKYLSENMLSVIGNLDMLVGVRLHSLIYAAITGTDCTGISYDPKCTSFLRSVGQEPLCNVEDFTAESFIKEYASRNASGKDCRTKIITEKMEHLKSKLNTNEDMILNILNEREGEAAAVNADAAGKNTKPEKKKDSAKTAGSIGIVFFIMLAGKMMGIVREILQASYFGTGIDADLYTAAYNSTLYLATTACYALCIAAVPILTREFVRGRKEGFLAANNLISITLIGTLIVVGIWQIWPSTTLLPAIWDVGTENLPRLAFYVRLMSLSLPIVAAAYLMVALFQSLDHYELQGSMSIPYNLFLSAFLFFAGNRFGIGGVVAACTFAWILQLAMSFPYVKKEKYVYRPLINLKAEYIGTYFKTAAVSVLTTSVFLFCYFSDASAVSALPEGSVSSFYYADKLFTPLITTVLYSISAVMFPKFNREFTSRSLPDFLKYIWEVTENILMLIFPMCAVMSAFGKDIIQVIFESGSFTAESTKSTGEIFAMYALGMVAFAILDVLNKAYYAMKKTAMPLVINLGIILANIGINSILKSGRAIAAGTSLVLTAGALVMLFILFGKYGVLRFGSVFKSLIATAAMSFTLYFGRGLLVNGTEGKIALMFKCMAVGAVAAAVYLAVSLLIRQKAISDLINRILKKA